MPAPAIHRRTPDLQAVDPRGLVVREVAYCRKVEAATPQAYVNRTYHYGAGRAIQQWDPRLWAQGNDDPVTVANVSTVYSLSGQVLSTVSVDSGQHVQLFGVADQALLRWDGRGTRQRAEYDQLLRPQAIFEQPQGLPEVCAERFEYGTAMPQWRPTNQCGRLVRHDDPAGTLHFKAFSLQGDCLEQTRLFEGPAEGGACTTRWRFSPLGEVLEQVDARDNRQVFGFTVDGRLLDSQLQVKGQSRWITLVRDIRYNAEGQIEGETAGNGVQTALLYRPQDGRLMERRAFSSSAGLLQHLIYDYDPMGNVLMIEDKALVVRYFANQRIDPISRFYYDSLYRLILATGWETGGPNQGPQSCTGFDPAAVSNYRQTYDYDEGGNLLKLTHVGAQRPGHEIKVARYSNRGLPYRNGRPPSEEEIAAAFDASGNLLELYPGRAVVWNPRNQLQSVSPVVREEGDDDCEWYTYDGQGQRALKVRSLKTRARTVIAQVCYLPGLELRTDNGTEYRWQVINARAGLNKVQVLHWEDDPPPGVSNNQYRCSLVDQLNSCAMELTDDARIISRETYYPFGETAWSCADDPIESGYKTLRYSGKERDATGLYYFGLRYYMGWLQRWLSPDPKGAVDGLNLYQMVGNSPMTYGDGDGGQKTEVGELLKSLDKQQLLLSRVADEASYLSNSILNHAYPAQRFKALGRRVMTQLGSSLVKTVGESGGGALGGAIGGLGGPVTAALGGKVGSVAGGKLADSLISWAVNTYQLDRPINLTGHEMNPKPFIESVEPKQRFNLSKVRFTLMAYDPGTAEGLSLIGAESAQWLKEKAIDTVASKLGTEGPGLVKTVRDFIKASEGLSGDVLSELYGDTSATIDMLQFRMGAITTEFAAAGMSDEQMFERISGLSTETGEVIQTLERNQSVIELVAPRPYAGRRQSLDARSARPTLARRMSR